MALPPGSGCGATGRKRPAPGAAAWPPSVDELLAAECKAGGLWRLWRQQVPYLYDMLVVHRSPQASTAVAWLPGACQVDGDGLLQRMVVGSSNGKGSSAFLRLLAVRLPELPAAESAASKALVQQKLERPGSGKPRVAIMQQVAHEGPVSHIAVSPHRELLLATRSSCGDVLLHDARRWGEEAAVVCSARLSVAAACRGEAARPLAGHVGGPAWSTCDASRLTTTSADGLSVQLWDLETKTQVAALASPHAGRPIWAIDIAAGAPCASAGAVGNADIVASCGADGRLCLWDPRLGTTAAAAEAHLGEARCVAFRGGRGCAAPGAAAVPQLLATGGADALVRLWDVRCLGAGAWRSLPLQPAATLGSGAEAYFSTTERGAARGAPSTSLLRCARRERQGSLGCVGLAWSFQDAGVLATKCEGGQVLLWDIARSREVPSMGDAADGPSDLIFAHGGHAAATSSAGLSKLQNFESSDMLVGGLAWSMETPMLLASASLSVEGSGQARGGEVHIWRPATDVVSVGD